MTAVGALVGHAVVGEDVVGEDVGDDVVGDDVGTTVGADSRTYALKNPLLKYE